MGYTLKEMLAAPGNYGSTRTAAQIRYIVIHYTGNDGDTAANNAAYYQRSVVEASAHYFVDDTTVWRSVPDFVTAWAVGGKKYASCDRTGGGTLHGVVTNANSISVELCDTVGDGEYRATEATLANAAALVVELMDKYGIPPEHVVRHFDVTGKLCPSYMVDADKWAEFKQRIARRAADNIPASYAKAAVEWVVRQGIMTGNADGDLMLNQPITRQQAAVMLYRCLVKNGTN